MDEKIRDQLLYELDCLRDDTARALELNPKYPEQGEEMLDALDKAYTDFYDVIMESI